MESTRDKKEKSTVQGERHFIFYVSDMEVLPASGHFRKMDAGREIVNQICMGMTECMVRKYTEYSGEIIDADSIGIVFPAHKWGISLAVYSFLQHLRFHNHTYVYAVAVGESISGGVDATVYSRLRMLEQFRRIFGRRCVGSESDIFIRCIDRRRNLGSTEEIIRRGQNYKTKISCILEGMLFHSVERLIADQNSDEALNTYSSGTDNTNYKKAHHGLYTEQAIAAEYQKEDTEQFENVKMFTQRSKHNKKRTLSNIYLDEDIFAGVKLCRVM